MHLSNFSRGGQLGQVKSVDIKISFSGGWPGATFALFIENEVCVSQIISLSECKSKTSVRQLLWDF